MNWDDGVYKLIGTGITHDDDEQFIEYYDKAFLRWKGNPRASKPAESVKIVIADSGLFTADPYFESRTKQSVDFTQGFTIPRMTHGMPQTTGIHGSHVASIAAYGSARIELIDVQVCSNQETGPQGTVWANALNWAAAQRPAVVNCSVQVPWERPEIQSIVSHNTAVLFVATAGNNEIVYGDEARLSWGESFSHGNTILVSGCGNKGEKITNRGSGSAVDLYAPSVNIPGLAASALQRLKFDYDQDRKAKAHSAESDSLIKQNAEALDNAIEEAKTATGFSKVLLENKIKALSEPKPIPQYQPPVFQAGTLSDSGSSFALPMVANVAAKMRIINPRLTASQTVQLLKSSGSEVLALNGRVMDPVAAYCAAYEAGKAT